MKREKNQYFESGFQILHVYFPIICLFDIMTVDFKTLYPIWSNVWLHNVLKRERELETLKNNVTLIRNSDDKLIKGHECVIPVSTYMSRVHHYIWLQVKKKTSIVSYKVSISSAIVCRSQLFLEMQFPWELFFPFVKLHNWIT